MPTNPLSVLPTKVRLYVYAVLGLVALGVAAVQAAGGDWLQAIALFLGSLGFGTAASNVPSKGGEDGAGDIGLVLLVLAVVGIGLLLLGVKF